MSEMQPAPDARISSQSRPAQHDRAVFLCVDKAFYPYALFLAAQIATRFPNRDFDISILSTESLPEHPLWEKLGLRVIHVDVGGLEQRVSVDARISFASYLRLLVPGLLRDDYRRLLYLDADVFYNRGDLPRLLNIDLSGRPVGAVRDMIQLRNPTRVPKDFKPFNLDHAPYFNAGILVIDTPTWNRQNIGSLCVDFAIENADKILQHDQTVLNIILRNNWAELPLVWNFMYSPQTIYFSAMFDVCFYHFVGRRKPFKGSYGAYPRRFTHEYRRFFDTHFPDEKFDIQEGLQIEQEWRKHIFVFLFHMLNLRRFLRNDDRFAGDWDVHPHG